MLFLVGVYLRFYLKYAFDFPEVRIYCNESTFQKQQVNVDLAVWDDV